MGRVNQQFNRVRNPSPAMQLSFANIFLILAALAVKANAVAIARDINGPPTDGMEKRCNCRELPSGEIICTGLPLCN
ncbi:hypothetical protein FB451DRAFT_1226633 [Mycena latifolia]|nr:hypothetical protein FB451DRAFT_1226633 [Mycena latifolia]